MNRSTDRRESTTACRHILSRIMWHLAGRTALLTTTLCLAILAGFSQAADGDALRVAVIGGIDRTGDWDRISQAAGQALDLRIETVLSAPREQIVPLFQSGEADLLLIHGGDETFALEALGYAAPLQTWAYNEFVIAGPDSDPAGVGQTGSGREALTRIQTTDQPLILFRDSGSHQVLRRLMDQAGLVPAQFQLLQDAVDRPQQILRQAAAEQAYVIIGHIPIAFERMPADGVRVLLSGDPAMRRGYVVVTPGPRHPATAAARNHAKRFADYLVSEAGQALVEATDSPAGQRWLFPRDEAAGLLDFGTPAQVTGSRRNPPAERVNNP